MSIVSKEGTPPAAAASAAAPGVPLGNNTDLVSQYSKATSCESEILDVHSVLPPPATVKAWHLRSVAREILQRNGVRKRAAWCGSRLQRTADGVSIWARPERAYGRIQGVCLCGQSIVCPVCAPRIAAFRAGEVAKAFEFAIGAGYEARLCTYTMPHSQAYSLWGEMLTFSEAWRRMGLGREAMKRNAGKFGDHVGREMTFRIDWHYHHHVLRYDRPGTFDADAHRAAWLTALERVGRRTDAADTYAFHVGAVGTEAGARYVAKLSTSVEAQARAIGSEIASLATKGRNFGSLLLLAYQGDDYAEGVWVRGVLDVTSHKVSSVRWSPGLRANTGVGDEKSDQEIVADEVLPTDQLLGALTAMQWRGVLMHKAEFALCCAANRGRAVVNEMLSGLGLGQLDDKPRAAVFVDRKNDNVYRRRAGDDY